MSTSTFFARQQAPPIPPKPKLLTIQNPPPIPARPLTEEQKQFWLQHGFLKIPQCFSREAADKFTAPMWDRLGASADEKSTWPNGKINMPSHSSIPAKEFAPKAWAAICELLGGEDRIVDWCKDWRDSFIPNFGHPDFNPEQQLNFRGLTNWHTDGDSFVHFLDSPEQALLVVPLFNDVVSKGGGTVICTDTIGLVARRLVSTFIHIERCPKAYARTSKTHLQAYSQIFFLAFLSRARTLKEDGRGFRIVN